MWSVKINIELKKGVLDAQGKATHQALHSLGFRNISDVRIGKLIELKIEAQKETDVENQVQDMCRKLLANPVIEDFAYEIEEQ